MSRLMRAGAVLGAVGLVALAMSGARAADKISVGYIPVDDFIPNFIAVDKGFYAKHGLDVNLVIIPLATNVPAALFSGTLQIGMSTTPIFMQARESGIDLAAFAGIAATLLDSAMGCCIHTTLKAGIGYTTVEIKINYVRAMTDKSGLVRAEGKVINVGSRIATSEGRLTDAAGKLLAHGTTTCLLFPI